jgi:hypothetical protein
MNLVHVHIELKRHTFFAVNVGEYTVRSLKDKSLLDLLWDQEFVRVACK